MNETVPSVTPEAAPADEKPLWTRPSIEVIRLEQTLNSGSGAIDTSTAHLVS